MPRPKTLLYTALGTIIGVLGLWHFSGDNPSYISAYALIGLIGVMLGFQIAKVLSGEIPWYTPHAVVLAAYFMMYCAAPAITLWIGPYSDYYERNLTGAELTRTFTIVLVGVACYLIGYKFGPKRVKLPRGIEWYFTDTPAVMNLFPYMVGLVLAIGLFAWGYNYATTGGIASHIQNMGKGRPEFVAESGGFMIHLGKFIWVGAALWMSRYGLKLSTIVVFGATAAPLLLYGSRSFIAILFIGMFIVWRFRWMNKVPLVVWAGMASALIILMSGYVILRKTGGDIGAAQQIYAEQNETFQGKLYSATHAFSFVPSMVEMVEEMGDKIDYQYGRTFGSIFFFVPTFIWPNQTEVFTSPSRVYTESLYADRADKITLTPTIMMEYYMNFGWFGVVLCSMFMGWFVKWFEKVIMGHPHRKLQVAWIAFGAVVTANLLRVMKNSFGALVFAVYFAVPMIMVYWPNFNYLFSPPPEGSEDEGISPHEYGYFGWDEPYEGAWGDGQLAHYQDGA